MARTRRRARSLGLALACLGLLAAPPAAGGGLARPNVFSPLGLGIGGAGFAGVANPSTIHYNPAGLTLMRQTEILGSLELVSSPRSWEPVAGSPESSRFALLTAPSLGVSTRLARRGGERPLPIAFGLGLYNSLGGAIDFDPATARPGVVSSSVLLLELVPTIAYEVSSILSIGIGVRIGFGLFSIVNTERSGVERAPADISGFGVAGGVSLGLVLRPLRWLRLGVVYSSSLEAEMRGDGRVEIQPGTWVADNVTLTVPWPQWAAFGIALRPHPSLELLAGLRWLDWSSLRVLTVSMSKIPDLVDRLDFSDGISAHLGLEWQAHRWITARVGFSYDSNTIPDSSAQRQYLDLPKLTAALGGSLHLGACWSLDLSYELLFGLPRTVPELSRTVVDPLTGQSQTVPVNLAPGRYTWTIHSLGLGARYRY